MKLRAAFVATLAAIVLLFVLLQAAWAQGGVIREIRVVGNNRIEADTVLSRMLLAPGDAYVAARADRSLKALFDSGLFADVVFHLQGDVLVVTVLENPVINRIAFEGNKRIPDESMEQEVPSGRARSTRAARSSPPRTALSSSIAARVASPPPSSRRSSTSSRIASTSPSRSTRGR